MKIRLLLLLMLASLYAIGQQRKEGTVMDAESRKPIAYASVGVLGTSRGTSSNLEGQFSIQVNESDTLVVTCVGYASKKISARQDIHLIELKPVATFLDGLVISTKPIDPGKIVRKAFSSVRENYNENPFMQKFFYRHYCNDDGEYGRLIEAAIDVWKDNGYRSTQTAAGIKDQVRVTQLRRSLDRTKAARGHDPISITEILETDIIGYQQNTTRDHASFYSNVNDIRFHLADYSFSLEGTTTYDGREVYKVAYESKGDSALTTSGQYHSWGKQKGMLFIGVDDAAIVKMESEKEYEGNRKKISVYYHRYNGDYYPYHFVLEGKREDDVRGRHTYHIELVSMEIVTDGAARFTGRVPGRAELLDIPYNATFWETSSILRTTPLEEEIVRDLGNGISLNEQFQLYRQYEMNLENGGDNGENKFNWLREFNRGRGIMYLVFWSSDCKSYLAELELAKRLSKRYHDEVTFVFLSLEDDETRWQQIVQKYVLFSDGIVNYRIGSNSKLARSFRIDDPPAFIVLGRNGQAIATEARRPSDPRLAQDLDLLTIN
jgi:hypothetical protein